MPRYSPQTPQLIDPAGVHASVYPRPMGVTTDASRSETVQTTGGQPQVDFAGHSNPYNDYQSIDLLLSLQHPRSTGYDEHCFYVMGQVKELLFKSLHFELYNAQMQLRADHVQNALDILPRAKAIAEYITRTWDVLGTISPEGFGQFRNALGAASGQLSFMYRHVEFILGNKSTRLASAFRNMPHVWPAIELALNSPSLWDDAIALLSRRGYAIDDAALKRDWSQAYTVNPSVEAAWLTVYQDTVAHDSQEQTKNQDLYKLAEALVGLSDQLSQYRWRHFVSVQRLLGLKPGTGGSDGVGWLRHVTEHRFFPELWSIRTQF